MNIKSSKLTLVVLTFNRPFWLKKTLNFLAEQKCPYPILILDGSRKVNADANQLIVKDLSSLNIDYRSYPEELSFCERMQDGLNFVKTKFSLVWTDDDFLVINKLDEYVDFLENNADYSAAIGHTLCLSRGERFKKLLPLSSYYVIDHLRHNESIVDKEVLRRIIVYTTLTRLGAFPLFYAMRTTQHLKDYINTYYPSQTGVAQELALVTLTLIDGKVKVFDSLYGFRNYSNDPIWTPTREGVAEYHNQDDIKKVKDLISAKMCEKVAGVNKSNADFICDQIVNVPYISTDYSINGTYGVERVYPYLRYFRIFSIISNFFRIYLATKIYKFEVDTYKKLLKSLK